MKDSFPYWKLKSSWNWWRENHGCSILDSIIRTIDFDVFSHIRDIYAWFWLKTFGKFYYWRIKRIERFLERNLKTSKR